MTIAIGAFKINWFNPKFVGIRFRGKAKGKEILIETNLYTTKYPSVVMNESTENSGVPDPSAFSTEATVIPAKLPWPMKLTSTGKKTPASAPPTLNIREPVLLSSEALMTGIDHARE